MITKYTFNLESVLNHRKLIEEIFQKELAVFKKLLSKEKKKLVAYKEKEKKSLKELRLKQIEDIIIPEILSYLTFLDQLSKELETQKERVLEVEEKLDQKREDLIEALKKRKILEKIKEKGWKEYRQELIKIEQNFLNELAIKRFNRNL
jgi:flagellar FliJ protein